MLYKIYDPVFLTGINVLVFCFFYENLWGG